MDAVNAAMRGFYRALWTPFEGLPPWVGLFALGLLFGVLTLVTMKYTANQKRVVALKSRYQGHILAIKLFRDSFTVVTSSLGKALGWIGAYLGEAMFKPMLVMIVPFMLLFAQMQMQLAFAPLPVGASRLVMVELAPGTAAADVDVAVELPPGVELAARPVREPSMKRVVFPIVVREAGAHELRFRHGGETVTKSLHVGDLAGPPLVSPVRAQSWVDRLLYPSEASFGAGSAFSRISLDYPIRRLEFLGLDLGFGFELGMACTFLVVSIVAAFALKGVFGVTI